MPPRALSEEDELEVVVRYKLGMSAPALAFRMRVDESTIRRVLRRRGVEIRPRSSRVAAVHFEVAQARAEGLTWAQVAERLRISATTARNRMKEGSLGS